MRMTDMAQLVHEPVVSAEEGRLDCPQCYGEGLDVDEPCGYCGGTGKVSRVESVRLGTEEGTT